ncbi:GGDEF domain-containing protein [Pseudokineococcus sp. 1T1Z-3]|uniref:GGDEF domain-containing protein n=1 Tax=Pseudokineococcus sp. 1T1Z-3 TaxID=3132745 RepID=UPI0030AC3FEA
MRRRLLGMTTALLVLAVGGGTTTAALLGRQAATTEKHHVEEVVAAYDLSGLRVQLSAAASDLAVARLLAGQRGGEEIDESMARARWESTYRSVMGELDALEDGPVGADAARLRTVLTELGMEGPTDLTDYLTQYTMTVFTETQETTDGGRQVPPLEAGVLVVQDMLTSFTMAQNDFAGAERVVGLDAEHSAALREHLTWQSYVALPAAAGTSPELASLSEGAPSPRLEQMEEALVGLADVDADLVADVRAVLTGPDAQLALAAADWSDGVLFDDAYVPQPASAVDAATAAVRTTQGLAAAVDDVLGARTTVLDERADALQGRADLLLAATLLVAPATLGGLGLLLHRRRHQERLLRAAADTDPLTGLANRRALDTVDAEHFGRGSTATHVVITLDLDGFKPVNDTYGHAIGDTVLRQVAQRCRDVTGGGDVVARIGGDEFVVVLLDVDARDAESIGASTAQRLVSSVRRPIVLGTLELSVGVSAGVAVRAGTEDLAATTATADVRLYEVKRSRPDRRGRPADPSPVDSSPADPRPAGPPVLPAQPRASEVDRPQEASAGE